MSVRSWLLSAIVLGLGLACLLASCTESVNPPAPSPTPSDTIISSDSVLVPARETQVAFLSEYATPEQLVADGDDDEASAWLWFHSRYPDSPYLYFGDIRQGTLDTLAVLFWLRDIETGNVSDVLTLPSVVAEAAPVITDWYRRGGNLILWGHAVPFVETLGRLPEGTFSAPAHSAAIGCGVGSLNLDHWQMAVQLSLEYVNKDHSTHPLFRGLTVYSEGDNRYIRFKGPGWTEDHNCVFFNYPTELTGRDSCKEICYTLLTDYYGIYPLATWDSQASWVSQLNIWEARQGQTPYQGRILCIGNGGCEFSMKSYRQVSSATASTSTGSAGENSSTPIYETTDDRSAYPRNNIYQDNILRLASNAVAYLLQPLN